MKIKRMLSFNSLRRKSTLDDMSSARNSESSTSNESRYSLTTLVKENRMPDLEVYLSKNDINGVSDAGIAPLHAACLYGNLDIAVWLLDKGASHKVLNSKGFTPFLLSCARGHVDIAKLFLERFDDCINDQDKNGRTALHLAGYFGQYEVLDYIMNLGEGPTYRTLDKFGDSVLHTACLQGNPDHIKYIAEADMSKLNAKNNKEETPLHILVDKNHSLAAVMLMGLGAEPNLQDKLGNGALHLAARKCSPDMTENDDVILLKMLDAGADIHAQNAEGDTVLHIVARNLANNIAGVLIERGADMDARNKMNRTPVIMMGGSAKRSNSFYKMNSLGQPN